MKPGDNGAPPGAWHPPSREMLRKLASYREALRERERHRLARSIEDDLGQRLAALRLELVALEQTGEDELAAAFPDAAGRMHTIIETLFSLARETGSALRPAPLEIGVVAAAEWLLEQMGREDGLTVRLEAPAGEPALSPAQAAAAFRILQEAAANTARHARADCFEIRIERGVERATIEARDDGVGFDTAAVFEGHALGLLWMRERALAAGGTFSLETTPGAGTRVHLAFPFV